MRGSRGNDIVFRFNVNESSKKNKVNSIRPDKNSDLVDVSVEGGFHPRNEINSRARFLSELKKANRDGSIEVSERDVTDAFRKARKFGDGTHITVPRTKVQ